MSTLEVLSSALALSLVGVALSTVNAFGEECKTLEKQQELNECYSKELRGSEQALNEAFKTIEDRIGDRPDLVVALKRTEDAWLAYRDAECLFSASGSAGGSVYSMILDQCKDELTRDRLAKLRAYLHCTEGDLACPVPATR